MLSNNDSLWLRSIRRYWILPSEAVPVLLFVAALPGTALLSVIGARQWIAATVAASFIVLVVQHFLFYRAIRCPVCGHNPTRYKNGRNIPKNAAWKRLQTLVNCPACHEPSHGPYVI